MYDGRESANSTDFRKHPEISPSHRRIEEINVKVATWEITSTDRCPSSPSGILSSSHTSARRWPTSGIEGPRTATTENSTRPPDPAPVASWLNRSRDLLRSPRAAELA